MDSAADRKSVRAKEKAARIAAANRANVIRMIMATTDGREWMWNLLGNCHIYHQTFTSDPLQSAFNEGQRSVGLALMADILTTCPEEYIQAQREANVRSTIAEQRSREIPDGGDSGPISDSRLGSEEGGIGEPEDSPGDPGHYPIGFDAAVQPNRFSRPRNAIDRDR